MIDKAALIADPQSVASTSTQEVEPKAVSELSSEERWNIAWSQTFGISSAQIFFPDAEFNARVYTLDGDSGYQVREKKVKIRPEPNSNPILDDSNRLAFPKKARQGERHGRARLRIEDIKAIRAWALTYTEKNEVPPWTTKAAEMNVSEGTLRDIASRRTWTHVT